MRGGRLAKSGVLGAVLAISLLSGLLIASQTAAQYPSYPTYPNPNPGPTPPGSVTIRGNGVQSYHFRPRTLNVTAGSTVTWSWQSNAHHNVTFQQLGKHSKTRRSETYKLQFPTSGTYRYLCTIHGFMGKIVVH